MCAVLNIINDNAQRSPQPTPRDLFNMLAGEHSDYIYELDKELGENGSITLMDAIKYIYEKRSTPGGKTFRNPVTGEILAGKDIPQKLRNRRVLDSDDSGNYKVMHEIGVAKLMPQHRIDPEEPREVSRAKLVEWKRYMFVGLWHDVGEDNEKDLINLIINGKADRIIAEALKLLIHGNSGKHDITLEDQIKSFHTYCRSIISNVNAVLHEVISTGRNAENKLLKKAAFLAIGGKHADLIHNLCNERFLSMPSQEKKEKRIAKSGPVFFEVENKLFEIDLGDDWRLKFKTREDAVKKFILHNNLDAEEFKTKRAEAITNLGIRREVYQHTYNRPTFVSSQLEI